MNLYRDPLPYAALALAHAIEGSGPWRCSCCSNIYVGVGMTVVLWMDGDAKVSAERGWRFGRLIRETMMGVTIADELPWDEFEARYLLTCTHGWEKPALAAPSTPKEVAVRRMLLGDVTSRVDNRSRACNLAA